MSFKLEHALQTLDWCAKKILDQARNRLFGSSYRGFSPKSPRKLTIPLFSVIGSNLDLSQIVDDELKKLHPFLKFKKPLVVTDCNLEPIARQRLFKFLRERYLQNAGLIVIEPGNSYENVKNIIEQSIIPGLLDKFIDPWVYPAESDLQGMNLDQRVLEQTFSRVSCHKKRYSIIYGFGGGSVIDVAQYAAKKLNIHFVSIPTSLAHDGLASQFTVINFRQTVNCTLAGVHTMTANVPLGIIVDTSLITESGNAYIRRIRAGIGDLLSNITASLDWTLASDLALEDPRHEPINYVVKNHAVSVAKAALYYILANEDIFYDEKFLQDLASYLIHSGRAMAEYGSSRPASGFEHKLYHAYNFLTDYKNPVMHGELAAIGTLLSAYAHEQFNTRPDDNLYSELRAAFMKIGLPTTVSGIESLGIDIDKLKQAIIYTINIKPNRYTIAEHVHKEDDLPRNFLVNCFEKVYL